MKPVTPGTVACILGASFSVTAATQASGQSVECGQTYTIVSGDTLSTISQRAYGRGSFRPLYTHNADVIGGNPNRIFIGQVIEIPCKNADGTFAALDVAPTPATETAAVEPADTEVASAETEAETAAIGDTIVFTFNKTSAPPFIVNSGIIDLYLAEITEVTEGRVTFVDPDIMNRNPEDQFTLVTSGQVDGAYVLNEHLSASHPLLSIPMLPLMGGSAEQTAVSLWRLHDEHLSNSDYFDDAKLLGFVAAPAAHIGRESDTPVTATEGINDKNMYPVPYFEGLDTRGPKVVRQEVAGMLTEYEANNDEAPAFFMAHGAARATGIWTDAYTVTEVDNGLYTPTFSVILSNEAWDRLSAADQAAIMEISGEKLSARSASWDAFDNGHRSHMIGTGLNIQKADDALLAYLLDMQNEGLRDWMQVANDKGIPGFTAINFYKDNLRQLEDRLIYR